MTVTETHLDNIRTDLMTGISRHNRRRNQRRKVAAVPVLGLIIAAGFALTGGSDNPAYALTQLPDGTIEVQVYPEFDDVEALQRDLEAAGLQVVVIQLRSDPSLEGVVEVSSHDNEASGAVGYDGGEFVIDAAAVKGEIEILIYSPTNASDDYQASPSVFAPGQRFQGLQCAYTDTPLTTADFEARVQAAGISNISWISFGEIDPDTGSVEVTTHDSQPAGAVTGAQMRNADTIEVTVDLDNVEPAAQTIIMNDGTHHRPVPTCTPELAAPWD